MKKLIICFVFVFFILHTSYSILPVLAAESTQSASPSSSLQIKLKALQDDIASKASLLKAEVTKKLQNKAFVGQVLDKTEIFLTLTTFTGNKTINLNEYTLYSPFKTTSKKITFQNILPGDYLAALGDVDDKEVLTAKKIVKLSAPIPSERKISSGQIITLGDKTFTIKGKDNKTTNLSFDGDTEILTTEGDEAILKDIKLNKNIIGVGTLSKDGVLEVRTIYIFPISANIKSKPATSSAQPKATSSAKNL